MNSARILPVATAEYQLAVTWYLSKNPQVAARFGVEYLRALDRIESLPELYGTIDGRHRWCPIKKSAYGIVYRVTPDEIVVVGIAHARQQPADWGDRG